MWLRKLWGKLTGRRIVVIYDYQDHKHISFANKVGPHTFGYIYGNVPIKLCDGGITKGRSYILRWEYLD